MVRFSLNTTLEDWKRKIPSTIQAYNASLEKEKATLAGFQNAKRSAINDERISICKTTISDITRKRDGWQNSITPQITTFTTTARQTDSSVAAMVINSQNTFFNTYSWLRPQTESTSFWDGWNKFWGDVGDALSGAWEGIKDFFTNSAIFQIVVSGLEIIGGVLVIAIAGIGAILSAGTATPLSIAAIAGGLAMIAHGSGGLQEGIQAYNGDENPSNWLKDLVGETAYNIIGIGGVITAAIATGGVSALIQLGAGMGVGMGSSWFAENVLGWDSTVSQWLGLGTGLFAAWGAGRIIKSFSPSNKVQQISPDKLRYSQENVSDYSRHIETIRKNNYAYPKEWDPVNVVKMQDGKLTTFDHRRVLAARETGIKVNARVYHFKESLPSGFANDRFGSPKLPNPSQTIKTWGDAITYRISNPKNPNLFKLQYPSGSWELPKINVGGKK